MTLTELRAAHPERFYQREGLAWWENEKWAHRDDPPIFEMPVGFFSSHILSVDSLISAAQFADLYVRHPTADIWAKYLWTCDYDGQGQRVYVGDNGRGLEIHRHIHLTSRFGVAVWR